MKRFKKEDLYFVALLVILFIPFIMYQPLHNVYQDLTKHHGMVMAFFKFGILATMGESLGLRIKTGFYNQKGFGLLPKAVVWGFLGILINIAFIIFSKGGSALVEYLDFNNLSDQTNFQNRFILAFVISITMNLIFAPVMMTIHKITDVHISNWKGKIQALVKPIQTASILQNIDWETHWNFVLKKTIPLFWIPAHTITFMLPSEYRVLFAAILGIVLGVLLSIGVRMSDKK